MKRQIRKRINNRNCDKTIGSIGNIDLSVIDPDTGKSIDRSK